MFSIFFLTIPFLSASTGWILNCFSQNLNNSLPSLRQMIEFASVWLEDTLQCREACQDANNFNRLASSLVERLSPEQERQNYLRIELGKLIKSGNPGVMSSMYTVY
jgi:hypothetical protein